MKHNQQKSVEIPRYSQSPPSLEDDCADPASLGTLSLYQTAEGDIAFRARGRHQLYYGAAVWVVPTRTGPANILIGNLAGAGEKLAARIRDYAARRVAEESPFEAQRDVIVLRAVVDIGAKVAGHPIDTIDFELALAYQASLGGAKRENWLRFRRIARRRAALCAGLLAEDLIEREGELPGDRRPKNNIARQRCARRGSLNDAELELVIESLGTAVADGKMRADNQLLCLLVNLLALRISQCAVAKVRHVGPMKDDGSVVLQVVRMKGRGEIAETVTTPRTIAPALAKLVVEQVERARAIARLRGLDEDDAPLFTIYWNVPRAHGLVAEAPGWAGHVPAGTLAQRHNRCMKKLRLVSIRTGQPMHFTPIRARRTIATHLRRAGSTRREIAPVLGHIGEGSVASYAEPTREVADNAAKALRRELGAMASAFRRGALNSRPGRK